MSEPKRKASAMELLDEPSSGSEVEDEVVESFDEEEEQMVNFEGRAACDPDCHGIALLLKRAFANVDINCMELADLIISQNYVGSVLMQAHDDEEEDNDTIFGVTTVINISKKKDKKCVQDLRNYIITCAKKEGTPKTANKIEAILNNDQLNVGYIVNERFVNIPCAISVPTFEHLVKEIDDLASQGMPFKFDYMMTIMKYFIVEGSGGTANEKILYNEEEALFADVASDDFSFKTTNTNDTQLTDEDGVDGDDSTSINYRMVILFEAKHFNEAVSKLDHFVNGGNPT